jgi:hypothetical protein
MNKYNIFILIMLLIIPVGVFAATDGVYNITVDNVGFAGGVPIGDGSFQLMDTIGEPLVGVGTSEDYKSQDGFWYIVNNTISLTLDSNTKDLGIVTAGVPNTANTIATVVTDAPGGYNLLISQNHSMTHVGDGTTTIPDYSGNIANPISWSGVGLGFTITNGTNVDSKWGVAPNNNYAGVPTSDTVFHDKTGYTSGGDDTTIEYKVDIPSTQKSGVYVNTITYTAISKL